MARLPHQTPAWGSVCLSPAPSPTALPEMWSTWEGCGRGEGALGSRLAPLRSLPQCSQGGESQISCIPGHPMPCEVGKPQARPLLNPEGARVVWVGRTGRGCCPNGSVGPVCLCEVAENSRLRGWERGEGVREEARGAVGPGVSELLPRTSPPHLDRSLGNAGLG